MILLCNKRKIALQHCNSLFTVCYLVPPAFHTTNKLNHFCNNRKFVGQQAAYLVVDMSTKAAVMAMRHFGDLRHDRYETSNLNGLTGTIERIEPAKDTLKC